MPPVEKRQYAAATRGILGRLQRAHNRHAPDQMRRLADLVIACAVLTITLPLMLLIALVIKCEGPGPLLERHSCIGRAGRFQMLRFRTSIYDPDRILPSWARELTPAGQFLRSTRIEALPQLINVLRGEMSLLDPDARSPSFLD
jgi:lipopolysaccharide/colanic/teichoic acid biosynthesis glycosyltransferase